MTDYRSFLDSKRSFQPDSGFAIEPDELCQSLKPWQGDCVRYWLSRGTSAGFEECGLGKTFQQLEWAFHVARHTRGLVLILCPLAVAQQTLREAERFGISRGWLPIVVAKSQDEIGFINGIVISNYEKLSKFDTSKFAGIVLDESSILKSFNGKTKQALCNAFASTRFKLACTATPAPNDQLELGNHSEFLGVLPSREMISRWFINDSMNAGKYRLMGHAGKDFWEWVSSWAVSLESPADLGYPDDGYVLPDLIIHEHEVDADDSPADGSGLLFRNDTINATTIHKEKRESCGSRAEVVAGLVNNSTDSWVVWCDTDYEADELVKRIPDAVEVRGSHSDSKKIQNIDLFSLGLSRVIITKPEICGFGLNWQHCHHEAFVGVSYSFERFYQANRRLWRFGQLLPVHCHVVNSAAEQVVWRTVKRKEREHRLMKRSMSKVMLASQMERVRGMRLRPESYQPTEGLILPDWMKARA